jgi:hypothetical protein
VVRSAVPRLRTRCLARSRSSSCGPKRGRIVRWVDDLRGIDAVARCCSARPRRRVNPVVIDEELSAHGLVEALYLARGRRVASDGGTCRAWISCQPTRGQTVIGIATQPRVHGVTLTAKKVATATWWTLRRHGCKAGTGATLFKHEPAISQPQVHGPSRRRRTDSISRSASFRRTECRSTWRTRWLRQCRRCTRCCGPAECHARGLGASRRRQTAVA